MTPIYSDRFTVELDELLSWIDARNPASALRYGYEIRELCEEKLADNPKMGRRRTEFGPDIRSFHSSRHDRTFFYRIDEQRDAVVFLHLRYTQDLKREDFTE